MTRKNDDRRTNRPACMPASLMAAALGAAAAGQPPHQIDEPVAGTRFLYEFRDIGTLGGSKSAALGMSDRGSIVGWAEAFPGDGGPRIHAFFWHDGEMTDLGTLGGTWGEGRAVNSARQVVGSSTNAEGAMRAFYHYVGEMVDLNSLLFIPTILDGSFVPPPVLFEANSINNNGQIVAVGAAAADGAIHGYLLTPREPYDIYNPIFDYLDLGPAVSVPASAGGNGADLRNDGPDLASPVDRLLADWGARGSEWDLDRDGVVAMRDLLLLLARLGRDGSFERDGSGLPDIGGDGAAAASIQRAPQTGDTGDAPRYDLPVEPAMDAADLNDFALVVGTIWDGIDGADAFAWQDSQIAQLEFAASESSAHAVNELGVIAGSIGGPGSMVACLWSAGNRIDLHAVSGWSSEALDVNDQDEAVGRAADEVLGGRPSAYLWAGGGAIDLNDVTAIPLMAALQIAWLEEATAIDESHRIAGFARTFDGNLRAFVLVPIDTGMTDY